MIQGSRLVIHLTVVVQILGAPEVVVTLCRSWVLLPRVLVDFEKLARSVRSGGIFDLRHVCQHGSPMGTANALLFALSVVVLVHFDRDCVTCLEATLAAGNSGVDVAFSYS